MFTILYMFTFCIHVHILNCLCFRVHVHTFVHMYSFLYTRVKMNKLDKLITDCRKNDGGFIMTNFEQDLPQFPEPYWLIQQRFQPSKA